MAINPDPTLKDPVMVAAGQRGAFKRWGWPKTIRLDDLTQDQRAIVHARVEALRHQLARAESTDPEPRA